jgi:hypothetical protein
LQSGDYTQNRIVGVVVILRQLAVTTRRAKAALFRS